MWVSIPGCPVPGELTLFSSESLGVIHFFQGSKRITFYKLSDLGSFYVYTFKQKVIVVVFCTSVERLNAKL